MSNRGILNIGRTLNNKALHVDREQLIAGKALVTAASGGGKSYALRKLLEQCGQIAQTIVLDWEGEFASLREKLDIAIVGSGGELPVDVRSAGLLARRLMEKEISAVIDLSDIKYGPRQEFIRRFCEEMVELPKHLWHDVFIALDEAQLMCPEKGQGESESTEAITNLCTLGRKRGYGVIAATQRLGMFSKTAAAQLLTKFVGWQNLDVDVKRAAFDLGLPAKDAREMLRPVNKNRRDANEGMIPGEFYGHGPAITTAGVTKFTIGECETTHPKRGQGRTLKPPKPSSSIKAVVREMADLPREAEQETRDLTAAKKKISELEKQLRAVPPPTKQAAAHQLRDSTVKQQTQTINRLRRGLEEAMKVIEAITTHNVEQPAIDPDQLRQITDSFTAQIIKLSTKCVARQQSVMDNFKRQATKSLGELQKLLAKNDQSVKVNVQPNHPFTVSSPVAAAHVTSEPGTAQLRPVERAMLIAIAQHPEGLTKSQTLIYADYRASGDTSAAFTRFARESWTSEEGSKLKITDEGTAALGSFEPLPQGAELREKIIRESRPVEAKMLRVMFDLFPESKLKTEVVEMAGYKVSGDTSAAFTKFIRLGWIENDGRGVKASAVLFPEHA